MQFQMLHVAAVAFFYTVSTALYILPSLPETSVPTISCTETSRSPIADVSTNSAPSEVTSTSAETIYPQTISFSGSTSTIATDPSAATNLTPTILFLASGSTTTPALPTSSVLSCKAEQLSEETWVAHDIDALLVNASRSYEPYPENNVQALAAYLGAPNFFCGVGIWCSAGQPCSPVGIEAWYVLMAIQEWNNYVNNLNQALQYTSTILSLKLPKIVNDLWPKPKDDVTPIKKYVGWTNGILNAFPITAAFGSTAGAIAAGLMGGNIIMSGMLTPPATDQQYLAWSSISSQLGSFIETYKQAITTYAERVINAPIDDPKFGINTVLRNGKFLTRGSNFTQAEFDRWMYKAISVNAIGSILQAQNVYVLRTFNMTTCYDENPAILCQPALNKKWTQYRLHKKGDSYEPIAGSTAKMLIETYGFTKEYILKGPADCFDANDSEQLADPWEKNPPLGFRSDLQDMERCNFNLNVCNYDMDEMGDYYAAREGWISALSPDDECGEQGIKWV